MIVSKRSLIYLKLIYSVKCLNANFGSGEKNIALNQLVFPLKLF